MKETKILKQKVEEYLLNVFFNSDFEQWDEGRTLTFKDAKKKTSILVYKNDNKTYIKMYLHSREEETKQTNNGNVYGSYTYLYERRIRAIHNLHFFCTTRKVRNKVKSIYRYFKEQAEYTQAKNAFDSLPTSYQRKEKLEQIENGAA